MIGRNTSGVSTVTSVLQNTHTASNISFGLSLHGSLSFTGISPLGSTMSTYVTVSGPRAMSYFTDNQLGCSEKDRLATTQC